ncbi:hypothetical protein C9426_16085 [Serratia sp. S1B]|nr:hypothetical protein C9426_16085 [Serratia sp. S1B]
MACKNKPVYPSYFKLHVCWLSSLTPVTYSCKLPGILCVAAFLQLELFRVLIPIATQATRMLAGA